MKNEIINFLNEGNLFFEILNLNKNGNNFDLSKLVQKSKDYSNGDFNLPLFQIAKFLKTSPNELSNKLELGLRNKKPNFIKNIESKGPFLNFYIDWKLFSIDLFSKIFNKSFFKIDSRNSKILIEYPSPNTNKSLHIGHVRNMLLGNSLSNILQIVGNKVIRTNLNNDRGIAICKSMLSYKLFSNGRTPKSMNLKPDEFVSYFYVLYNKKNKENPDLNLDEKAQEMLLKWENGDVETRKLWKELLNYVFEGYKETYNNFKVKKFDKEYFESEIYDKGRDLILNAYESGIQGFEKSEDGAILFNFNDKTYGKKYLLRKDGTSLYMTQDLYLADLKEKEFHPDKSIFVVGQEQKYHFEVLFKIFEKLNLGGVEKNYHLAYGYVYDKNGKKFSSRLGNTLGADETLELVIKASKKNLIKKSFGKISNEELDRRSKIIGFSALAFMFLKVNPKDDIKFDIEKAISFEGRTGPYIQYTYARIKSILRKAEFNIGLKFENLKNENLDIDLNEINLNENEENLLKIMNEFQEILIRASDKYNVSLIGNYLIELAQKFNEYYQKTNILKSNNNLKEFRLFLIYSISLIIKKGLELYNIEVLEEM